MTDDGHCVRDHWLTIERVADGYRIEADGEQWHLTDSEMDAMQDALDWDSPWRAIAERTNCLDYLRRDNDRENECR